MHNSVAASRQLAVRVVLAQLGGAALVGVGFLLNGWRSSVAALVGGGIVAVGTGLLALRLFSSVSASAGTVFVRLIVGTLLKWVVIVVGLYLAMAKADLPPLPIVVGVIAALIPQLFGLHESWMERV